jgi:itaconate CoA-transferase
MGFKSRGEYMSADTNLENMPLSGINVVALEQAVAAPLCTRTLADLGARVIKVEGSTGDTARHYNHIINGTSDHFVWLNRNKESIVLNLKEEGDKRVMERLLGRSDVFVHNLGPGAVERLGFGWEVIHSRWPNLISCGISGFGRGGPYENHKAYDLIVQAEAGVLNQTGSPEAPAKVAISVADVLAGKDATIGLLAALIGAQRTSQGSLIDISMLDSVTDPMVYMMYQKMYAGRDLPRSGPYHATIQPYGPVLTGDSQSVVIAVQTEDQWRRLCAGVINNPELADDPLYRTNDLRVANRDQLIGVIEESLAGKPRKATLELLEAADIPYGSVSNVQDLINHPQHKARGRWIEVRSEDDMEKVVSFASPIGIVGMPIRAEKIPSLGEHTEKIKRELGV